MCPITNRTKWKRILSVGFFSAQICCNLPAVGDEPATTSSGPEGTVSETLAKRTRVTSLGRLEPDGQIRDLNTSVPGTLASLLVEEGQIVEVSQPLARTDSYQEKLAERGVAATLLRTAETRLDADLRFAESRVTESEPRSSPRESVFWKRRAPASTSPSPGTRRTGAAIGTWRPADFCRMTG